MKTVAKTGLVCLALLAGMALCMPSNVAAQAVTGSNAVPLMGSPQPLTTAKTDASDAASSAPAGIVPLAAAPSVAAPALSSAPKSESIRSGRVPESVKDTVKRLSSTTEGATLEDLNAARETIAKLDLLIDIEKRLNDLSTLRQERDEKSGGGLAGAIPASALSPKIMTSPAPMPALSAPSAPSAPNMGGSITPNMPLSASSPGMMSSSSASSSFSPAFSPDSVEILRIVGSAGRYAAYVKTADGKTKIYHDGDKLSDGSVIRSISSRSMTVEKNKKAHIVKVKDVSVVFNGR